MNWKSPKLAAGTVAVLIFIVILLWGRSAESAELGIGLGAGVSHTENAIAQEISLTTSDYRWYGQVMRIGGEGVLQENWRWSAGYRLFWRREARFKPFLRIGAAYFDHPPVLVTEHLTYDLGVGFRWADIVELEYNHNSTAGRSHKNTGIDFITLRAVFQF